MIVREFYATRKDGVKLFYVVDALTDENGNVVYEEVENELTGEMWKKPVARGFKILQNETQQLYAEAIDVDGAPYTYSETDKPIEVEGDEECTT